MDHLRTNSVDSCFCAAVLYAVSHTCKWMLLCVYVFIAVLYTHIHTLSHTDTLVQNLKQSRSFCVFSVGTELWSLWKYWQYIWHSSYPVYWWWRIWGPVHFWWKCCQLSFCLLLYLLPICHHGGNPVQQLTGEHVMKFTKPCSYYHDSKNVLLEYFSRTRAMKANCIAQWSSDTQAVYLHNS